MKRLLTALMTLMFMLTMTATPVLAKGGGGGSGSGGNGNSGSQAGGKSSISSSVKGDSTSKNAVNSNNGNKGVNSNNNTGNTQNTENLKTAKEKAQTALANKDISTTDSSDTTGHWASKSIKIAKSLGIVNGYPDGSFKPDNSVTNAEAVVIMVKMAELVGTDEQVTEVTIDQETTDENTTDNEAIDEDTSDQESTEETESDQMPAWAKESFKQAGAMGIVNLNRFHSQVQANRAQCAVMLAKALNLEPSFNDELPFSDVGYLSGEDLGYLVALQQAGIIAGSPGGKFNPNSSITRGEIAAMLAQVVEPDADETTDGTTTDGTTTDGTTT
ncbi:MAG: S-layer homology domain-containing protein [Syntrophomonadaceae bacterium]